MDEACTINKLIEAICEVYGKPHFAIPLNKGVADWRNKGYTEQAIVADLQSVLKGAKMLRRWENSK